MNQKKKHSGKGFTLYEYDLPQNETEVWVLIAESCYEISRTLLAENSYADEIYFSTSGYEHNSNRGGFGIKPNGFLRYPIEIYKMIYSDKRSHQLIQKLFHYIRRIQIRVACKPFVLPLFYEKNEAESKYELMEKIRHKIGIPDIIGSGLEGIKNMRISTYTPKRSDEIKRAFKLLALKPHVLKFVSALSKKSYWYRQY